MTAGQADEPRGRHRGRGRRREVTEAAQEKSSAAPAAAPLASQGRFPNRGRRREVTEAAQEKSSAAPAAAPPASQGRFPNRGRRREVTEAAQEKSSAAPAAAPPASQGRFLNEAAAPTALARLGRAARDAMIVSRGGVPPPNASQVAFLGPLEAFSAPPPDAAPSSPRGSGQETGQASRAGSRRRPRPTHFVAVRVSAAQTLATLEEVQAALPAEVAAAGVPLETAHVTLCVARIEAHAVGAAADAVAAAAARFAAANGSQLSAPLRGLGHFRDIVLFLQLAPSAAREALGALAADLAGALGVITGVQLGGGNVPDAGYEPHVTVAKVRKAWRQAKISCLTTFYVVNALGS